MTGATRPASPTRPADTAPPGLPGLDPRHSHVLTDARGASWHYLDTGPELAARGVEPVGTVLAVHGNPTWSYLWRRLVTDTLDAAEHGAPAWRVVAVDQLEMGLSQRTGSRRPLARRVADLGAFTDALGLAGPVVTLGHDWGGVVSLGWAVDHPDQLAGVALLNTAVHQPDDAPIPAPLRLALAGPVHRLGTRTTRAFLETTLALARPRLAADVAAAYRLPYLTADERDGIEGFVADIPVDDDHPSAPELHRIAAGVAGLTVPAVMLWGPHDPIFSDRYLDDLVRRLPHAHVHRFSGAGHLIAEDVDWTPGVLGFLAGVLSAEGSATSGTDALTGPRGPSTSGIRTSVPEVPDPSASRITSPSASDPSASRITSPSVSADRASRTGSSSATEGGLRPDGGAIGSAPAPSSGATAAVDDRLELRPAGDAADRVAGSGSAFVPLWAALDARADDDAPAVLDMTTQGADGRPFTASWRALDRQVRRIAAGLHGIGVRRGDRVSLLVEPGPTLTALVYACLRIGAVVVVADAGLGVRGLTRAQRGAWPRFVVAQRKGLAAARALGWPGVRISAEPLAPALRRALGVTHELVDVARAGDGRALPPEPGPDAEAAVLFTSGSTGPAKGVVYRHAELSALRDALAAHFDVSPETGLVTGFAPFALLGPALGTRSVTPVMDVSSPATLTARAVADAVRASDARIVFLSPAAILNVVDTADALDGPDAASDRAALARVRTFLSTGAPISAELLGSAAALMPAATPHTPYGMTECLLVTDITLDGIRDAAAAPDDGVCVGRPVGGGEVLVSALDDDGAATGAPTDAPGVLGEVLVRAGHLKERYDRLWLTDLAAERDTPPGRWHRTGDVGHLDDDGRLWVEGRLAHVLRTADGPLAPVGTEQHVERVPEVRRAALVGVGPAGVHQPVAVVETVEVARHAGLAPDDLAAAVRAASPVRLAAVLVVPRMPTDVRHNSKIDRARLAAWADRVLTGGRVGRP